MSKWKENFSSECKDCGNVDTLVHYFFECPNVINFWKSLSEWLNNAIKADPCINLDCCDIMLGKLSPKENTIVINFVLLQAKWFIYCKKLNNNNIVFKEFRQKLMYRLQIEEQRYHIKDDFESFIEIFESIYSK